MANLKNLLHPMTDAERNWFDSCPKAVLFEIARQFAMRGCVVPQKPKDPRVWRDGAWHKVEIPSTI